MSFKNYLILLPRIIFIFFVPWSSQIVKTNSLPWIAEYEFSDHPSKASERIQKNTAQSILEKRLLNTYERKFNEKHEKLRSLINHTDEKIYINQINMMYDLLAEQIRNIGFSCPTTSTIKERYCNEKKIKGFENGKQKSYCERDFEPSPIVYSYKSNEYSYSDSGDVLLNYENEDLILDDPSCISVIVDGDVLICGDLTVANGQLNTLTSFDAFEAQSLSVSKTQSMHAKRRCIIRKGLTVRGSMILPFSNLIVIGKLIVGKNVYTADLQIDLSSNMFIGVLYLFSDIIQNSNEPDRLDPFSLTRIKLFHASSVCLNKFDSIIYSKFQNTSESTESGIINQNLGSLWSGRKIYVGNSGKLWVRGDIHGGEVVISDAGLVFGTCGNLKTNTTHGLGIHIMDSGGLHMMNSSIFTSRLSVIRSSVVTVKKGELNINNILLLHSGSKIRIGGNIMLHIASIRESSSLYADSLKVLNQSSDNIDYSRNIQNISSTFGLNYNRFEGKGGVDKFSGYFQVISASTVTIYGGVLVKGSIEISDGSEVFSIGKIMISENVVISDGSEMSILGNFNSSMGSDWNIVCEWHSHCVDGSILISNSSNMFIGNGNLKVNEYLDLIGGVFLLRENLQVGKSVISTRKSIFFINEGNLVIKNIGLSSEKNPENKSFLISNSVFLIKGKLVVGNGDVTLIMKSYLEAQQAYIEGSLGMSTRSFMVINGEKINKVADLFAFKNTVPISLLISGNITADAFSEMVIFKGNISTEAIMLTSGSKINITKKINSGSDLYQVRISKVVVLQGNSFISIPEGYILEVNNGIMVDEFSIMNCDQLKIKGDLFIDDGGTFIAKSVKIFYPSTLVSQDSSKIYIEHLQVFYSNTEENTLPNKHSEISKIPLFISENGGSIKIQRCEYNCEELKCIISLFGIRTIESIISIEHSNPWFIPVKTSVQFFDLNSTRSKEVYKVIDPIAFIVRKNPEERKQIQSKPEITFSKGEQVRRGRTWETSKNTINFVNESQPIQWQ